MSEAQPGHKTGPNGAQEAQLRVIGYVRVSTDEQAANGNGLEAQEHGVTEACRARAWELVGFVKDEGVSSVATRPGLAEALERLADGQADVLMVSKLDRLTRSVVDLGQLLEWADRAGVALVALDLGLDTSTPAGRLVANVMASVAQWEREVIGQRTREGLAAKRARGERTGRPSVADNPELAEKIRRWHEDEGYSLQQIADFLNDESVPTIRGGTEWRKSSVQAVLGYRRPKPERAQIKLPGGKRRRTRGRTV